MSKTQPTSEMQLILRWLKGKPKGQLKGFLASIQSRVLHNQTLSDQQWQVLLQPRIVVWARQELQKQEREAERQRVNEEIRQILAEKPKCRTCCSGRICRKCRPPEKRCGRESCEMYPNATGYCYHHAPRETKSPVAPKPPTPSPAPTLTVLQPDWVKGEPVFPPVHCKTCLKRVAWQGPVFYHQGGSYICESCL